jgi:glutathione peroxidase
MTSSSRRSVGSRDVSSLRQARRQRPKPAPVYAILSEFPDDQGKAGKVTWNFEKFLVGRDGHVIRRFRPKVVPEDPNVVASIEALL